MERTLLTQVDGNSALSPSVYLEAELSKDRWDARNIPGLRYASHGYEQQLLERIEIGKQANNAYWIEINQRNLDERLRPAIAMLRQGQIVAENDKYEREYTPEEWEQQQQEATNE